MRDAVSLEIDGPETWAVDQFGILVVTTSPLAALESLYEALDGLDSAREAGNPEVAFRDSLGSAYDAIGKYRESRRLGIRPGVNP
ncbi:hypothetical protein [Streptomyces sp. NPDC056160]|uniref:hypothetical protein n=1 Tax=Streptomyces sp. NPDC056160 TaxID=3345731 RepID=UPI0035D8B349